jgi:hypothetical protein
MISSAVRDDGGYDLRLEADDESSTTKMLLLR